MKLSSYKSLDNLFTTVGSTHKVSPTVVKKVYESVFSLMRHTIKDLPELKTASIEEISQLRTNFFIPKFCRFYIDLDKTERKLNKLNS